MKKANYFGITSLKDRKEKCHSNINLDILWN